MKFQKWWSLALCFATLGMAGCSGTTPDNLGVENGRLAPCPSSPNCVSTQAEDPAHSIDPLAYTGSVEEAQTQILAILQSMERVAIVRNEPGYGLCELSGCSKGLNVNAELVTQDTFEQVTGHVGNHVGGEPDHSFA